MDEFTYQDNNPIYDNQVEQTDLNKLEELLSNCLPNYNIETSVEDLEEVIILSCDEHEANIIFYEGGDLYYSFGRTSIKILSDWTTQYYNTSFSSEFIKAIFTYQNYMNHVTS